MRLLISCSFFRYVSRSLLYLISPAPTVCAMYLSINWLTMTGASCAFFVRKLTEMKLVWGICLTTRCAVRSLKRSLASRPDLNHSVSRTR